MAANWTAIENALQAFVVARSGLAATQVIWAHQNASQPAGAFITLEIVGDSLTEGSPEVLEDDTGTTPGAEVTLTSQSMLDCGLRIQCFTPPARGTAPGVPTGSASARAILSQVRTGSALTATVEALAAAGVSVYDLGAIQFVPAIAGTDFEGRGVLDLRFYVLDSAVETTTYIGEVDAAGTVSEDGASPVAVNVVAQV
jgi:hypothetical protein